ncbi:F-box/kelch-repeat protein [Cucurbita argyrosperma subsp. argyrosperma]|nr:F-box/kelch-repeat protein [Cucurbita argyrosperma subsp. argyrosperma]
MVLVVLDKCEVDISSGAAIPSRKEMERMIQPPLVDTTACLCRVDAGLKTVAGAKKFVPGSKLCLQPSIKPSIHPTRPKPTRSDRSRNQSPLLPGLPDDLAIACLIRVPRVEHRKLRLVCKRWYRLLAGNFFYSLRKSLGVAEEWIYVVKKDRDNKISWHAFDPIYQLWQPLPPVPREYSEALGFGCAVLSGCHLYLFGGKDPIKGAMRRVIFYSARTNKWHRAPDMLRRRYVFGSCVINNCLYVAGGENEGGHRSLRSAEVYDPNKNRWTFISDMSTPMVPVIGVVYEGKWYLKGYGAQRQVLSDVYQPETDTWCPVYDGMVPGWSNPSVSLNGHLYAVDCRDGCKLRVYDEVSNSWNKSIDSKLHMGNSQALEAVALVPLNGKLCIVRNNMSISLVDVLKCEDASGASGEHLWETLAGKGHLKTLVTNLWSSLSGRSRLKSHIVHCQVLQA